MVRLTQILLSSTVLILAFSCTKDSTDSNLRSAERFTATFDTEISKVHISHALSLAWDRDDRISVFSSSVNEQYLFEGNTGDTSGTFKKEDSTVKGSPYSHNYAIYPYATATASSEEGTFTYTLPHTQYYTPGSFDSSANPMVAVTQTPEDKDLCFSSACGMVAISFYNSTGATIRSLTFRGNNDENISGEATITSAYGSKPSLSVKSSESGKSVIVDFGVAGVALGKSEATATKFYVVLPPTTFTKGFSLTAYDIEGMEFQKSTSKSLTVGRGSVLSMQPITFATVTTKINGTDILSGNNLIGLIKDKSSGAGIAGVPVSDGFKFVLTDKNGVYQMQGHDECRKVYYSLPSGYRINVDPENNVPLFYSTVDVDLTMVNRNDFTLEKEATATEDFTIIAIGDPQCKTEAQIVRYEDDTIDDIKSYIGTEQAAGRCVNPFAITLGDIIYNTPNLWSRMKQSMSNVTLSSGTKLPVFQTIGNHDHNYGSDVYEAREGYNEMYGPTDYSFNVGKAHIIVMDNIICTSRSGTGWSYLAGISDEQLQWLTQDISYVDNKENKIVVFCCHAPFGAKVKGETIESEAGSYVNMDHHYHEVLTLLAQFHDAKIFCGHRHVMRNYVNTDYICQSGRPLYEHNVGAACGGWWTSNLNCDGTPIGYMITEIKGNSFRDQRYKVTDHEQTEQIRVYDGNQIYTSYNLNYCWYSSVMKCGSTSYTVKGFEVFKDSFVVSIFAGDYTNWTVSLYRNDEKVGDFTPAPKYACDICTTAFFYRNGSASQYFSKCDDTEHYWYFKAPNSSPSTYTNWEIRAVQKIPDSNIEHVYKADRIKVNFSGFEYGTTPDDPPQPKEGDDSGNGNSEGLGDKTGEW